MSVLRKRLYYIWKKLSEKSSRKKFEQDHNKDDLERFKNCVTKKGGAQIKREMKALHQYWDCFPYQYYRYDFYRNDCTLTLEEMKLYVPHFFIMSLFFPLSYKEYGVLCEDKLLTYATLKAYEIPQPKMLFGYDHESFFDASNNPISASTTNETIDNCAAAKLFVKPRFGLGGKGITVFNRSANRYVNADGLPLSHAFFAHGSRTDFYIVQEGLTQYPVMNALYPDSVNTFRVFTDCTGRDVRVLYALVRMGSGGQQIDNASSGGLYLKIDPETGILAEKAFSFNRKTFDQHPDTGFIFKEAHIEVWEEVKQFTISVAKKFRDIKYMGWDIAYSIDGPVVIELNNAPGIGIIQDCYGGIRDDLQINPKDWWYKSDYTLKNL